MRDESRIVSQLSKQGLNEFRKRSSNCTRWSISGVSLAHRMQLKYRMERQGMRMNLEKCLYQLCGVICGLPVDHSDYLPSTLMHRQGLMAVGKRELRGHMRFLPAAPRKGKGRKRICNISCQFGWLILGVEVADLTNHTIPVRSGEKAR
jgi:hypothetical protein